MNKKIITASLAALALTGGAFSVSAEEMPVYSLDAIVVTANRTPEKQIDSNANVSVVTAKEIEQKHYDDVVQAVQNVPGVSIANHGANSQVGMSDQIYINGSPNVVVLVDGMRKNTNGNSLATVNIGDIVNMDSIDHIEVLKGSASTLYGSDAQGGVVNIITKKAKEDGTRTTLRTSFGNADKEKYTLYNEGKEGQFFWNVEAGKELQGNYKDGWGRKAINHLNAEHYNLKLGYDLNEHSNIVFNYQKYKSDYALGEYNTNDSNAAKGKKDNDSLSLQYKAKINDHLTNQFSIYRNKNHVIYDYNHISNLCDLYMKTIGISDQLTYTMSNQTIIGGIDWYKDEIPYYKEYYGGTNNAEGTSINNLAFYLQDKINLTDQWNITPGVRVDHHSEFGTHTSPSLSIGFKQNEKTNYYVNYKEFFVAPNLFKLYYGKGNHSLDPEEGYTLEFGVNHQFTNTLSGAFNIFHTHAKNYIDYDKSNNYSRFINGGHGDINGFSINLNKEINQYWATSIGYSYLYMPAKPGENINNNGDRPESTLNVSVVYQADNFNANLSGRGIMNRYGPKGSDMKNYANYWVWDLAANYQFTKEATLFARVNNIFDQFYTDTTSWCSGPNANPLWQEGWYSAQGRNFEVGLQFQF